MGEKKIPYDKRPRNVGPGVLESWQKNRRPTDARELMKFTGKSLPLIYAALNNGYVSKPALAQKITDFYLKRTEAIPLTDKDKKLIDQCLGGKAEHPQQ